MRANITSSRQPVAAASETAHRRGWRRLVGTSLASILLLGSASAFAEDGGGDDAEGDGDDGEGDGDQIQPASEHDGMYEPCDEGFFGDVLKSNEGLLAVVFDADGLDEDDLDDQLDRVDIVVSLDGEDDCLAPLDEMPGPFDFDLASFESATSDDTGLGFDPPQEFDATEADVPPRDGTYIRVFRYPFALDADYRLELDWRYQGLEPALSFVRSFTPYQITPGPFDFDDIILDAAEVPDADEALDPQELEQLEANPLEEAERRANWTSAMEDPTILSAAVLGFDASWYDVDGDPTDAPDDAWEMTLTGDEGQGITLPGGEDDLAAFQLGSDYSVAGDLPEGWELVACGEDVDAVSTGVGDFSADDSGTHVVCVQEIAEEPPAAEDDPELIEIADDADDTEEDELPATGVAPLGMLALGAGLTFAGAGLVRRRR